MLFVTNSVLHMIWINKKRYRQKNSHKYVNLNQVVCIAIDQGHRTPVQSVRLYYLGIDVVNHSMIWHLIHVKYDMRLYSNENISSFDLPDLKFQYFAIESRLACAIWIRTIAICCMRIDISTKQRVKRMLIIRNM